MNRLSIVAIFAMIIVALSSQMVMTQNAHVQMNAPGGNDFSRGITSNWYVFGHDERHTFRGIDATRGIGEPSVKWTLQNAPSTSAVTGNFLPSVNGFSEARMFVVFGSGQHLRIVDGTNGEVAWELNVDALDPTGGEVVASTPAILDLNSNSYPDIVFATSSGNVYAFEPRMTYNDGSYSWDSDANSTQMLWHYSTGGAITEGSIVYGDLGNTSTPDIVFGAVVNGKSTLFALDGENGNLLWKYTADGGRISTPAIYPYSSTTRRVVFNTLESTGINQWTMHTYMLRNDGVKAWSVDFPVSPSGVQNVNILPSPAIGEMDGDSTNGMEIVVTIPMVDGKGQVAVLHRDGGTVLWQNTQSIKGQIDASPGLDDLNGDGIPDVAVISWYFSGINPITRVYALNGKDGAELWERTIDTSASSLMNEYALASPAITDLNKDGTGDIVVLTSPSVYALNGKDGTVLWNYTATNTIVLTTSPAVDDLDMDGFIDIIAGSLCISDNIVDFAISSNDITVVPDTPVEGSETTIAATVHNLGQGHGNNIVVRFMDGDKLIGDTTIESIGGYDTQEATIKWTPDRAGIHTIRVIVDPENQIEEPDENNNEAAKAVEVEQRYVNLRPVSIKFYRADGTEADGVHIHPIAGKKTTIKIRINNTGNKDSGTFTAIVKDNGNQIGGLIAVPSLPAHGTTVVSMEWTGTEGNHDISVEVDPDNSINESNEMDNNLSRSIYVKSADPGGASYIIQGLIFMPDGKTLAPNVNVTITDLRTGNYMKVTSGENGDYYADLKDIPGGYMEEDSVRIYAENGIGYGEAIIIVYSEDKGTIKNIVLNEKENRSFTLSLKDDTQDVYAGTEARFNLTLNYKGNVNTTISLSASGIPSGWEYGFSPSNSINVTPGDTVHIIFYITPPRDSGTTTVHGTIRGVSGNFSSSVDFTLNVKTKPSIAINITDTKPVLDIYNSNSTDVHFAVENTGSETVILHVDATAIPEVQAEIHFADNDTEVSTIKLTPAGRVKLRVKLTTIPEKMEGKESFGVHIYANASGLNVSASFTVRVLWPDLTIDPSGFTIIPLEPEYNSVMTYTITVRNSGKGTAPQQTVALVIAYPLGVTEVELVIRGERIEPLSPGGTYTLTGTWIVNMMGHLKLIAAADYMDDASETMEDNNRREIDITIMADLKITDGDIEVSGRAGDIDITVTVDVVNSGNAPSADTITLGVYYITSVEQRIKIGTETIDTLDPGENRKVKMEIKSVDIPAGIYRCIIEIDINNNTAEMDENNNEYEMDFTVRSASSSNTGGTSSARGENMVVLAAVIILIIALLYFLYSLQKKRAKLLHKKADTKPHEEEEVVVHLSEIEEIPAVEVKTSKKPKKVKKVKKLKKE